jgi:hypothetical protein
MSDYLDLFRAFVAARVCAFFGDRFPTFFRLRAGRPDFRATAFAAATLRPSGSGVLIQLIAI